MPFYGASDYFYVNQATITIGASAGLFTIPATFPISTATHRQPFYGFMAGSHLKTRNNNKFYFWTDMPTFTSTSFTLNYYYYYWTDANTGVTTYYGF
jgi:hypothetical protein